MSYKVIYHPRAEKFLIKLNNEDFEGLKGKLEVLADNPFGMLLDIKKLSNHNGCYRLRYRKIRVIYQIDNEGRKILITDIDFRGNIY